MDLLLAKKQRNRAIVDEAAREAADEKIPNRLLGVDAGDDEIDLIGGK